MTEILTPLTSMPTRICRCRWMRQGPGQGAVLEPIRFEPPQPGQAHWSGAAPAVASPSRTLGQSPETDKPGPARDVPRATHLLGSPYRPDSTRTEPSGLGETERRSRVRPPGSDLAPSPAQRTGV